MIGSKLNKSVAKQYSQSFASIVVDDFFSQNEGISGPQIVGFTPVKQVNFFVLKNLFNQWQEETKKLKSPYFNYKNDEVNQALKTLVNTLSKNILISKEDFKPLLESAVMETLELLYDPYSYYKNRSELLIAHPSLGSESKYFKIYKSLFETLASASDLSLDSIDQLTAATEFSEAEFQENVHAFSTVLVISGDIQYEDQAEIPVEETPAIPADDLFATSQIEEDLTEEFQPGNEQKSSDFSSLIETDNKDPEVTKANLNEQYSGDTIQTLNQRYEAKEKKETIATKMEEKAIESLALSISINQRYMFINDLFDGNEEDYLSAIDQVDIASSFDESVELLVHKYSRKYGWNMNSEEVKSLLKIIFKRFR
ncbi:hypothetical protein [Reichenbachiella versicolor]|uniref:hypothetical protein n=1 Tax=Reichenbachiella versicolor TaxID=1821036 RepID=UPI000D6E48B3|nr:hypothetical protein [Reichenbachiella versicolor]